MPPTNTQRRQRAEAALGIVEVIVGLLLCLVGFVIVLACVAAFYITIIWAVNTLFHLAIPYSWRTVLAAWVVWRAVRFLMKRTDAKAMDKPRGVERR